MKDFDDIWPLMKALWPHADLGTGHELRGLYRKRLGKCRPELLEIALEDVRANYSSRTPELKWILERYRTLYREWKENTSKGNEAPVEDDGEDIRKEVERDRQRIAFNLSLLTTEEIDELREEVARRTYLQSILGKVHGSPETWSHFTRGMVWALYTSSLSGQSHGPSQELKQPG